MFATAASRPLLTGLMVLAALGCQEAQHPLATGDAGGRVHDGLSHGRIASPAHAVPGKQLAELRSATARFHRFEVADEAGYDILVTHPTSGAACLEDPREGGMGRHYLKLGLVDDQVAVLDPEIVIYEPMKNGRLRLVGFEYIIPWTIRGPEEAPPTLLGQEFLPNETFELWMLHVYAWKHNPSGIFATWNPKITCEHDAAAG